MPSDTTTTLGANIAAQRDVARMGQAALAQAAGISVPYLSDIERGKREPSVLVVARIAAALSVTVDDLLAPRERFAVYAGELSSTVELLGVVKAHSSDDALSEAGRRWPLLRRMSQLLVRATHPNTEHHND